MASKINRNKEVVMRMRVAAYAELRPYIEVCLSGHAQTLESLLLDKVYSGRPGSAAVSSSPRHTLWKLFSQGGRRNGEELERRLGGHLWNLCKHLPDNWNVSPEQAALERL